VHARAASGRAGQPAFGQAKNGHVMMLIMISLYRESDIKARQFLQPLMLSDNKKPDPGRSAENAAQLPWSGAISGYPTVNPASTVYVGN
jgi:hypothetical protein